MKERQYPKVNAFSAWLQQPVSSYPLGLFRILFGVVMFLEMIYYFRIDLVRNMFVLPAINFRYEFFYWLRPMPATGMYGLIFLLAVLSWGLIIGNGLRWTGKLFALLFLYLFLLDKSIYNNHIYLFILIAFLMSLTDAGKVFTIKPVRKWTCFVPKWQVLILQVQIVIVYVYGGIAKLTHHWLIDQEPIRSLVAFIPRDRFFSFLNHEAGIMMLTYGGIILDIGAPLWLWYKPLRRWAIIPFILFHIVNSMTLDDIGFFPYLMLCALIIFYDWHELPWVGKRWPSKAEGKGLQKKGPKPEERRLFSGIPVVLLAGYFTFQLLFPFRGFFLPNPMDWTTIGNRFSWRMKVDSRVPQRIEFKIKDQVTGQRIPIDIRTMVNDMQLLNLCMDPRSVRDFSQYLRKQAFTHGVANPAVFADIRVRYNGVDNVMFIDTSRDISKVPYAFSQKLDWVMANP